MTPEQILAHRYRQVRERSERLCLPLAPEDHVPQPLPEVSPPKWHLAHTAWFFETMVLAHHAEGYRPFDKRYAYLFNSYYESLGERALRAHRGHFSRPTVAEVLAYRAHVDAAMLQLLGHALPPALADLVDLGLHHEQQHQELLLTDLKVILGQNPLAPAYDPTHLSGVDLIAEHDGICPPLDEWITQHAGTYEVGHGGPGFAFDNESPRHAVLLQPVQLRAALVTNDEYRAFMDDGGYERFEFWQSDGWQWVHDAQARSPMYWRRSGEHGGRWVHYTLAGEQPVQGQAPVTHVNAYEAHAFCAWAGWRLPTEFEWETLAPRLNTGRRWEWTGSAYLPYPGFTPHAGNVGEYNGKFMINQMVLRGASFATPPGHARPTYRNFFLPAQRWQYTGIRPARPA